MKTEKKERKIWHIQKRNNVHPLFLYIDIDELYINIPSEEDVLLYIFNEKYSYGHKGSTIAKWINVN